MFSVPFGIKPLFYTETKEGFWFASEIKALLEVEDVERKPSLEAIYHFLSFDYVPDALTPFAGIHELKPGFAVEIDSESGKRREWCFFDFDYTEDNTISREFASSHSRELLQKSVERTLISDVPVGVMLSGGMDSSALTALMARVRGDSDFHTFSLGFDDKSFDESDYATSTQGGKADTALQPGDVHFSAISGDYNDLDNKPTKILTSHRAEIEDDNYIYSGFILDGVIVIKRTRDGLESLAQNLTDLETDWLNRLTLNYI